jgi:hypothetical protein
LVQAMAKGDIADMNELRDIVKHSVSPKKYLPQT